MMIGLYLHSFSFLAWILRCDFRMRWKKLKGVLRVYISIKHGDSTEMDVCDDFRSVGLCIMIDLL